MEEEGRGWEWWRWRDGRWGEGRKGEGRKGEERDGGGGGRGKVGRGREGGREGGKGVSYSVQEGIGSLTSRHMYMLQLVSVGMLRKQLLLVVYHIRNSLCF